MHQYVRASVLLLTLATFSYIYHNDYGHVKQNERYNTKKMSMHFFKKIVFVWKRPGSVLCNANNRYCVLPQPVHHDVLIKGKQVKSKTPFARASPTLHFLFVIINFLCKHHVLMTSHNRAYKIFQKVQEVSLSWCVIELLSYVTLCANTSTTLYMKVVVSESFEGKTLLERQRAVNESLKSLMPSIHAVTMKTWTPAQYEAKKAQQQK